MTPFQTPKPKPQSTGDEDRLDKLFDRTHQIEQEEQRASKIELEDSLRTKVAALSGENGDGGGGIVDEGMEGGGKNSEESSEVERKKMCPY